MCLKCSLLAPSKVLPTMFKKKTLPQWKQTCVLFATLPMKDLQYTWKWFQPNYNMCATCIVSSVMLIKQGPTFLQSPQLNFTIVSDCL